MKSKMMKQINKYLAFMVLSCFLICGKTVYAAEEPVIIESYTGISDITVYVKGIEETADDVKIQIGTTVCDNVKASKLAESGQPVQTLIMVDNSLSIPESERGSIAQVLQNLISDRGEQEEIAIATFDEEIKYLVDYSSDYTTLKSAVDSIEYQDLETYLTDVLYELLITDYKKAEGDVYRRIVVISDGVDNKSIGYTKDELYALLKEYMIPIYTVGVQTSKNDEQLENMFALTRMTNAESFLLNDMENLLDINDALNQDRNIVKYVISPDAEMMDGSRKAVMVQFVSGQSLSVEVAMPQQEQEIEEVTVEEPKMEVIEEVPTVQDNDEKENSNLMMILVGAVCFVIVVAAVVSAVLVLVRKNKKKNSFEAIPEDALWQMKNKKNDDDGKTELIGGFSKNSDDGTTFMMWNTEVSYDIVLTDIHSPVKSFQAPLRSSVVIGRKQDMCGIVIDYDKSVSGKHCEIKIKDGKFFINDLQSANGTYVNGCKVLTEIEIFSGNIIKMGRLELRFEVK